jgi:hypothetical protein
MIDPRGPRLGAAVTTVVLALVLLTGSGWLLAAQAAVFALGAAGRSPYGPLWKRLRRTPPAEMEDARPPRFAQTIGLAFAVLGLVGAAVATPLFLAATAAALAAAFLNAAFDLCLGCELYLTFKKITATGPTDPPHHREGATA